MASLDLAAIGVFVAIVLIAGLAFSRSGQNMSSFFAAGGSVPWGISGISLFMSFFSVGTFVVWGSIAYQHGFVAITIQLTMSVAGFIVGLVIAPAWNRTGALTAAEYISKRLGRPAQKFYTYLFLFSALFTAGAFLYPIGKIIEVATGVPLELCIVVLGSLVIAYTAVGGLWAVLVTDVLQFVVLTAAVIILVPLALGNVQGLSGFLAAVPEGFTALTSSEYSWGFMFAFGLYNAVFIGGNWAYVQRYTSVANPAAARRVGLLFGALYIVSPIVWMLPPMIYRVMEPTLSGLDSEGAYLLIAKEVLPSGIFGIVLGGMIFATASSVNTTLNICAGVFTNDVFRFLKPDSYDEHNMLVARLATVTFGVFAVVVALLVQHMGGIVEVVFSVAALTGGALFLPPIWSLFSRRQTGFSVVSTTIVALAINLAFKFVTPTLFDLSLSRSVEMIVGVFVPIALLCGFELLSKGQVSESDVSRAAEQEDNSADNSQNIYGTKVIAYGVLATGAMIAALGLIADQGAVLVSTVGLVICGIASVVLAAVARLKA